MNGIPVVLSPAQQRAAARQGIEVPGCLEAVLGDPNLRAQAVRRLRDELGYQNPR